MKNTITSALPIRRVLEHFRRRQTQRSYTEFESMLSNFPPFQESKSGSKVLFWPFRAHQRVLMPEIVLATGLQLRGHQVGMFFCNGRWDCCNTMCSGQDAVSICRKCCGEVKMAETFHHITYMKAKDFHSIDSQHAVDAKVSALSVEEMLVFEHNDIDIGREVRSSVQQYLLKAEIDPKTDAYAVKKYFTIALQIYYTAEKVLLSYRPDRVVVSHGVYTTWGLVANLAEKMGIPAMIWRSGFLRNTVGLSRGLFWQSGALNRTEWNHALAPKAESLLSRYIQARVKGKVNWAPNPRPIDNQTELHRVLGLDPKKKIAVLFTNVAWDAGVYWGKAPFANMMEWLLMTVEWFSVREEWQLVIRIHPGELQPGYEAKQTAMGAIAKVTNIGKNIKVVPPESRLSSYSLGELAAACLVFSTNMGLEMAAQGKFVVVAGDALYRGQGFTTDVSSKMEYMTTLESLSECSDVSDETREAARRFLYHVFLRLAVPFPFLKLNDPMMSKVRWWDLAREGMRKIGNRPIEWTIDNLTAMSPLHSPSFDILCDSIINARSATIDPVEFEESLQF